MSRNTIGFGWRGPDIGGSRRSLILLRARQALSALVRASPDDTDAGPAGLRANKRSGKCG